MAKKKKKQRYAFPTVSRCPRCGSTQTHCRSTQGKVQYRICNHPICRKTFTIIGRRIEKTSQQKDPSHE